MVNQAKQAVRDRVWAVLERERAVPPGVYGHIPSFFGAEQAAERLGELPDWQAARVVKTVPDTAQKPVRELALGQGKLLYMAVPKLAEPLPFRRFDPATPRRSELVAVENMLLVDLIVCGSVAVDRRGVRLGKGAGYSDIEVALLQEAGLIGPGTTIATTVHRLQVLDEDLPEAAHDFRVDVIVTPDEVIRCDGGKPPSGLIWNSLSPEQITAIPALAARRPHSVRPKDSPADCRRQVQDPP
jgi:5-formyltetrahydrofolate cyclo-ligase